MTDLFITWETKPAFFVMKEKHTKITAGLGESGTEKKKSHANVHMILKVAAWLALCTTMYTHFSCQFLQRETKIYKTRYSQWTEKIPTLLNGY